MTGGVLYSIEGYVEASKEYTVKQGESLYLIAKKHNMDLKDIVAKNSGIKNPNLIYPGQKIKL